MSNSDAKEVQNIGVQQNNSAKQNTSANKNGNITIKSINVPLQEIPINTAYKVPLVDTGSLTKLTEGDPPQISIFASNNKKHIAVVTPKNFGTEPSKESTIEMFNEKGNLEWETSKKGFTPCDGQISNNGNSNFLWSFDSDYFYNLKLSLYDIKGYEIFSDSNINYRYADKNNEIVYYLKDQYQSNNKDDVNILYCYNSKSKNHWNKKFESSKPLVLLSVSGDGSSTLCGLVSDGTGSNLFSVNKDGGIIWQKEFKENLGLNILSYNGDFSVRIYNNKFWELYNNKGEIIFRKEKEKIDNYDFLPNSGCFIKNDDTVISIASNVAPQKTIVTFYNLKGNLLDHLLIPIEGSLYIEVTSDGIFQIYFDNLKVQDYQKGW